MIAQFAFVAVLLLPQTKSALPLEDPWFSPDKAKHFAITAFVESATFAGLESVRLNRNAAFAGGISVAATAGLLREVHDKRVKNQFSFKDLTWDLAGGVAAFVMLRKTER